MKTTKHLQTLLAAKAILDPEVPDLDTVRFSTGRDKTRVEVRRVIASGTWTLDLVIIIDGHIWHRSEASEEDQSLFNRLYNTAAEILRLCQDQRRQAAMQKAFELFSL